MMIKRAVLLAVALALLFAGVAVAYTNSTTTSQLGNGSIVDMLPLDGGEAVIAVLSTSNDSIYLYHMRDGYTAEYVPIPLEQDQPPHETKLMERGGVVHLLIGYADGSIVYHTWKLTPRQTVYAPLVH